MARQIGKYHRYVVTVTEKYGYVDGAQTVQRTDSHDVEVDAPTAREAVSKARQQRRDQQGRYAVPATFRAKREDRL